MGIYSDLEFDGTRCKHCNKLLYKNFGGKKTRGTYTEWDSELVLATVQTEQTNFSSCKKEERKKKGI